MACPTRADRGMNWCDSCRQDFGGVISFDAHRVGKHEFTYLQGLDMDPPREDGRRCLDINELETSPEWTLGSTGRWSLTKNVERGAALASQNRKIRG